MVAHQWVNAIGLLGGFRSSGTLLGPALKWIAPGKFPLPVGHTGNQLQELGLNKILVDLGQFAELETQVISHGRRPSSGSRVEP
jgi:hypothetical protein